MGSNSNRRFVYHSFIICNDYVGVWSIFQVVYVHSYCSHSAWLCIVGAAPFAAIGFIKYHGMTAEQFVMAFIKSEFLDAKKIPFKTTNIYYEALKPYLDKKEREVFEAHD